MSRFAVRVFTNPEGQRVWVIWDALTERPADGFYAIRQLADDVAAGANALMNDGGDPYHDWCWDDGRGQDMTRELMRLALAGRNAR